ncbi:MAG: dihydrofolate reductase [Thiohalocapsa sp.]
MTRTRPLVTIVAAMAHDRVIGRDNRLPWHLPADLAHFKSITLDKPIIMGRRTWQSLPGLLPRRRHIVITRDPSFRPGRCDVVNSPQGALKAAADEPEIMVVGGASIYIAMLPLARRMELTMIDANLDGDTRFPSWDGDSWVLVTRKHRPADDSNAYAMDFIRLECD